MSWNVLRRVAGTHASYDFILVQWSTCPKLSFQVGPFPLFSVGLWVFLRYFMAAGVLSSFAQSLGEKTPNEQIVPRPSLIFGCSFRMIKKVVLCCPSLIFGCNFRMMKQWAKRRKRGTSKTEIKPRWEQDYELVENEGLFQEYLEMSESGTKSVRDVIGRLFGVLGSLSGECLSGIRAVLG